MRIVRVTAFVLSIVVLSYGSTANAGLLNGGFETGDLAGWTTGGAVWATSSELYHFDGTEDYSTESWPDWGPRREGAYFAVLQSVDLNTGLPSRMSQSFQTLTPGYNLSFDYFFDYGDYGGIYVDTARATLWGPGDDEEPATDDDELLATLFEHNTATNLGWTSVAWTLASAGMYTLKFESEDYDGMCESYLGVDNVNVVPVPGALLLGALGLGSAGGLLRRLRRGSAS